MFDHLNDRESITLTRIECDECDWTSGDPSDDAHTVVRKHLDHVDHTGHLGHWIERTNRYASVIEDPKEWAIQ